MAAEAERHFQALKNFENTDEKTKQVTHYVEGLSYRIRPGNAQLAALAAVWEKQGLITFGAPAAKTRGSGKVS